LSGKGRREDDLYSRAREELRALIQDEKKRRRVVSTLAQTVWREEREQLEREKSRGMKG
jgi:hypothetical protein